MDCSALNIFCYICDHKFTDQKIINDMEINDDSETCKIYFSDDFYYYI